MAKKTHLIELRVEEEREQANATSHDTLLGIWSPVDGAQCTLVNGMSSIRLHRQGHPTMVISKRKLVLALRDLTDPVPPDPVIKEDPINFIP